MSLPASGRKTLVRFRAPSKMIDVHLERALLQRWQNVQDDAALVTLVEAFQPLATKYAYKHSSKKHTYEELLQEANLGLVVAASRFDPNYGTRFSTYALIWITAQIRNFIRNNHCVISAFRSPGAKNLFYRYEKIRRSIDKQATQDEQPFLDEHLATACGVQQKDVPFLTALLDSGEVSLDAPRSSSTYTGSLTSVIELPSRELSPEDQFARIEERHYHLKKLREAFDILQPRERTILIERWLSGDRTPLKVLGSRYGISAERVRQIETAALGRLRAHCRE